MIKRYSLRRTSTLIRLILIVTSFYSFGCHNKNNSSSDQASEQSSARIIQPCEIIYKCGKQFASLSKHILLIDDVKYTYKVNQTDITKEEVVKYITDLCKNGNLDVEANLYKDWDFECP